MKFYIVLGIAASLTIAAATIALYLASQSTLNEHQLELMITAKDTYQLGIGSLFGLLGSKLLL
jgi:hypothetical protein